MNNAFAGGDPSPLMQKELRLEYRLDGMKMKKTFGENQPVTLPAEAAGLSDEPSAELRLEKGVVLEAWQAGTWILSNSLGEASVVKVDAVTAPLPVTGPWELSFQANRGAPASVRFEKLIPWNESSDAGVKYFSGTGTYATRFVVPADLPKKGRRLLLDLGRVEVIAEVKLNGKELGILWKPPFRVDVGDAVKPGENRLEVKVVNLWPNRLIGDEQLPEDVLYEKNGAIKEWPAWLLKGTPRSSGRTTFVSWKHWKKDDALLDSGLLGPVTLRVVELKEVK
jgi:hypothetical protein